MTFVPLRGCITNLSARGSVVFCLARRGLIYISSRVSRQTIHPDRFSFPCSIGFDFSFVCKESDLQVIGSFHGCVDSPLVACWISVSFFELFSLVFHAQLVSSILRCLGSDLLVGIMDSCLVHLCA
jgi:ABC-type enterochelin transport system permease subunit